MNKLKNLFGKKNQPAIDATSYPEDIENNPAIADSSYIRNQRLIAMRPQASEASNFKILRAKILRQLRTNQWNSFGISSSRKGEGKSMIAANLAISIAMDANQSVLLIDMDFLDPKLAWYFNINVKNTIKDCLFFNQPLSRVLLDSGIERLNNRLNILPSKPGSYRTSDLISNPKMQRLIAEIKANSEGKIIIFDLPPILVSDDVLASIDYYDALLFVVEDGANSGDDLKKALQMVGDKPFLGTVLNKSNDLVNYQDYYYSDQA